MRKSRIKFTEVEDQILIEIAEVPMLFFDNLEELAVKIPEWSELLLLLLVHDKGMMEIDFFEDAKDFFLTYTKKVLRHSDEVIDFICFSSEEGDWRLFTPPTLIGTNLKTKLR